MSLTMCWFLREEMTSKQKGRIQIEKDMVTMEMGAHGHCGLRHLFFGI